VRGLPRRQRLRVSLLMSSFDMAMPVVVLLLGQALGQLVALPTSQQRRRANSCRRKRFALVVVPESVVPSGSPWRLELPSNQLQGG